MAELVNIQRFRRVLCHAEKKEFFSENAAVRLEFLWVRRHSFYIHAAGVRWCRAVPRLLSQNRPANFISLPMELSHDRFGGHFPHIGPRSNRQPFQTRATRLRRSNTPTNKKAEINAAPCRDIMSCARKSRSRERTKRMFCGEQIKRKILYCEKKEVWI